LHYQIFPAGKLDAHSVSQAELFVAAADGAARARLSGLILLPCPQHEVISILRCHLRSVPRWSETRTERAESELGFVGTACDFFGAIPQSRISPTGKEP
jgi:hypothetical protein